MNVFQLLQSIVILSIILFIDCCLYGFFEQHVAWFLLAYCLVIMIATQSRVTFCLLVGVLAVESLLFYGHSGVMILYTVPLALLGRMAVEVINAPVAVATLGIIGVICTQLCLIDPYILARGVASVQCTMISIAVTLLGTGFFYLKFQKR